MKRQGTVIVGLTGQTGAGKSTLSRMFADRGAAVIDADQVARETMEHKLVLADLVLAFSTEVINPDATLNRKRLAQICFGDRQKLRRLNEVVYPYIVREIEDRIDRAAKAGARMVLLDAPTLYESGLDKRCDRVVAVLADREVRRQRILQRDRLTPEEADLRINAQHDDGFYRSRADDILENNDGQDSLRLAFLEVYDRLERLPQQPEPDQQPQQEAPPPQPEPEPQAAAGALEELEGQPDE